MGPALIIIGCIEDDAGCFEDDDEHQDSTVEEFRLKRSPWCLDDAAEEQVFIPDGAWPVAKASSIITPCV